MPVALLQFQGTPISFKIKLTHLLRYTGACRRGPCFFPSPSGHWLIFITCSGLKGGSPKGVPTWNMWVCVTLSGKKGSLRRWLSILRYPLGPCPVDSPWSGSQRCSWFLQRGQEWVPTRWELVFCNLLKSNIPSALLCMLFTRNEWLSLAHTHSEGITRMQMPGGTCDGSCQNCRRLLCHLETEP